MRTLEKKTGEGMAKRDKKGKLRGSITGRVQVKNPKTGRWVKIDTSTGTIIDHKKSSGPYKGIRKWRG